MAVSGGAGFEGVKGGDFRPWEIWDGVEVMVPAVGWLRVERGFCCSVGRSMLGKGDLRQ